MKAIILLSLLLSFDVYARPQVARYKLGQALFFDKILSGNKNISCATCHHPFTGSTDWLSLGVGEGGTGLGFSRTLGTKKNAIHERVPRNAPHLFNLTDQYVTTVFHDGRVEVNPEYPNGFKSPAGHDLPEGLNSILAVQALFPPTSNTEMAGNHNENPIGHAATNKNWFGKNGVWDRLVKRIRNNSIYVDMFKKSFREIKTANDIREVHIANAIATFEEKAFLSLNSPFDQFIRGDETAISRRAKKGYELFKGKGQCISCHNGTNFSDNKFHSIALPQIGPGKGHGSNMLEDFGRFGVTGKEEDLYKFKTPILRNIALTGPYGHNGAYDSLKDIIKHHVDGERMLYNYNIKMGLLKSRSDLDKTDVMCLSDEIKGKILATKDTVDIDLSNKEINLIIDFLHTLTDPKFTNASKLIPTSVPSGLPVHD
ncbi:cytochrome-c peroxidase [Halobacteriovorax vibrionivorans]|uniref:Cytochrome-c peroxidase n=1 Tax=Halobacteriovorax vibrionivorans TaxID=2152716 RepID=A0ABY0IH39_9BACT|nr:MULTISPECIES: cytochrome c peroxidase [Halobacteriovorax]RZF20647.1 cytochrome-c peroxidase [Halobacteriovorax vibrionivorans]TGD48943.1 cytochrome-c peroxidase [Halobacteriovorax sp. Y22]